MAGTEASIRIKLGQIEIDYQGDASFLKKDLLDTVKDLLELQKKYPAVAPSSDSAGGAGAKGSSKIEHSTDTIATMLGASSAPDLALAAAAHMHFTKGKQKFTRQEIIAEMRTAPGHFKESYMNNLSYYLKTLTKKDRLRFVGGSTYALSNKERLALEVKLAQA
jgi:hypothetical protein